MQLGPELYNELHKALTDAYRTRGSLKEAVRKFGENLENLAGEGGKLNETIGELIDSLAARDQIAEFISSLPSDRPYNVKIAGAVKLLATWVRATEPDLPKKLESLVFPHLRNQPFGEWLAKGAAASGSVCKIESNTAKGTGFLVAKDLVLTCEHVMRDCIKADPTNVKISFADHGKSAKPISLHKDWHIASDPDLDWALIKLASAPACKPIADWGTPLMKSVAIVLGHPLGDRQHISLGEVESTDHDQVTYHAHTEGGSSGSPVFDQNWKLIAMHNSAGNKGASAEALQKATQSHIDSQESRPVVSPNIMKELKEILNTIPDPGNLLDYVPMSVTGDFGKVHCLADLAVLLAQPSANPQSDKVEAERLLKFVGDLSQRASAWNDKPLVTKLETWLYKTAQTLDINAADRFLEHHRLLIDIKPLGQQRYLATFYQCAHTEIAPLASSQAGGPAPDTKQLCTVIFRHSEKSPTSQMPVEFLVQDCQNLGEPFDEWHDDRGTLGTRHPVIVRLRENAINSHSRNSFKRATNSAMKDELHKVPHNKPLKQADKEKAIFLFSKSLCEICLSNLKDALLLGLPAAIWPRKQKLHIKAVKTIESCEKIKELPKAVFQFRKEIADQPVTLYFDRPDNFPQHTLFAE